MAPRDETPKVNVFSRLRDRVVRTVVALPVITEQLLESPGLERQAAIRGLVPKRCGLCKHFSRSRFTEHVQKEPAFVEAMRYMTPAMMGRRRSEPYANPGSEAARELRPNLVERWEDYGVCLKHEPAGAPAIWGFIEQPPMPQADSEPCEAWR